MPLSNSGFNGYGVAAKCLQPLAVSGIRDVYRQIQVISVRRGGCGVDGRYERGRAGMRGDQRGGGDRGGRMDTPAATERAGSTPRLRVARGAARPAPHDHPGLHHADAHQALNARACHQRPVAGLPSVGAGALPSVVPTSFAARREEVTDQRQARAIEERDGGRAVHEYCDALFARRIPARAQPLVVAIYVDRMISAVSSGGPPRGRGFRLASRPAHCPHH